MAKIELNKPILICFYGYPGAGKSFVARNLENTLKAARVSADRIRHELFRRPRYDDQENAIIVHLMNYMTEEFLKAGVSVLYDTNAARLAQRRRLRELARGHKAHYLLVWLQIDPENAFLRNQRRDRRVQDNKYTESQTQNSFEKQAARMQNPQDEEYLVVSGKHSFTTQKNAILSRLYNQGLITASNVQRNVAMPELINLIPSPHTDPSRRNINIL